MIGSLIPVSFPQAGKEGKAGEHRGTSPSRPSLPWVALITGNWGRNKCRMLFVCFTPLMTIVLTAVPEKRSSAEAPGCGWHRTENGSSRQVQEGAEGLL